VSPAPAVSVVIPTRDAGPGLARTLEAILSQEIESDPEVIIIDSGSTDGTVSLCRSYPVTVFEIAPESFGHGRTRNLGICRAQGDFVALLVQDAIPADPHWLAALVAPLQADAAVAGAFSRQLPRPEADWIGRHVTEHWHRRVGGRWVLQIDDWEAFAALPWDEKLLRCGFNDVSSVVRRAVWEQIPLPDVPYAEDVAWALEVLRAGYQLVYEPSSQVVHSHQRSWQHDFRRAYVDGSTLAPLFGPEMARPGAAAIERTIRLVAETCGVESVAPADLSTAPPAVREAASWYRERFTTAALAHLLSTDSPWAAAQGFRAAEVLARYLRWEDLRPRPDSVPQPGMTTLRRLGALARGGWLRAICGSGGRVPASKRLLDRVHRAFWQGFGWQHLHWAVTRDSQGQEADALDRMAAGEFWGYTRHLVEEAEKEGVVLTPELASKLWHHAAATAAGKWLGRADHAWGDAADVPSILVRLRAVVTQGEIEWDLASLLS
jgi:rhamnosyltransferase